jgi:hypothetical protein
MHNIYNQQSINIRVIHYLVSEHVSLGSPRRQQATLVKKRKEKRTKVQLKIGENVHQPLVCCLWLSRKAKKLYQRVTSRSSPLSYLVEFFLSVEIEPCTLKFKYIFNAFPVPIELVAHNTTSKETGRKSVMSPVEFIKRMQGTVLMWQTLLLRKLVNQLCLKVIFYLVNFQYTFTFVINHAWQYIFGH